MDVLLVVDKQFEDFQSIKQPFKGKFNVTITDDVDRASKIILEHDFQLVLFVTSNIAVPEHWNVGNIQKITKCQSVIITKATNVSIHLLLGYVETFQALNQHKMKNAILEKSLPYIEEHLFEEDLSLEKVASNAYVSSCHFSRLFQKHVGQGFKEYVINKRIDRAKILLENGEPVTTVCYAVGYNDLTHFARIFKRIVGVNPSVYKQKVLSQA